VEGRERYDASRKGSKYPIFDLSWNSSLIVKSPSSSISPSSCLFLDALRHKERHQKITQITCLPKTPRAESEQLPWRKQDVKFWARQDSLQTREVVAPSVVTEKSTFRASTPQEATGAFSADTKSAD
jgi:hypothetical protein